MSISIPSNAASLTDRELLDQCLAPRKRDRDAFAALVSRYQSLVCSVAYSILGDLGRSEDIAQDAFVAAWKQLDQLREREKFKSWVCGITRNLAHKAIAKRPSETVLHHEAATDAETPDEQSITREEADLLWRALDSLPENYREPLVLFYREERSVAAVAGALELSESAVKQRLARGREMMRGSVTELLENALLKTRPGPVFTLAVMGALPGILVGSASAASVAGAGAKAGSLASGALAGILGGFGGAFLGYKASQATARYESQRAVIRRSFIASFVVAAAYLAVLFLIHDNLIASLGATGIFMSIILALSAWGGLSSRRQIREAEKRGEPQLQAGPARRFLQKWEGRRYDSDLTFLGFPLLSIQFSDPDRDFSGYGTQSGGQPRSARGWVAIGDKAYGLVALGNIAYGGIAFGGMAIGGVAFGGGAVGVIALGGGSLGILSIGGLALGFGAVGGAALGHWGHGGAALANEAALGGVAIARDYAVGSYARALHTNDEVAREFIDQSRFFEFANDYLNLLQSPWAIPVIFAIIGLQIVTMWLVGFRRKTPRDARLETL